MNLYSIIAGFCSIFYRVWAFFFREERADPPPYKIIPKRPADTWPSRMNQRRARKAQRHATRTADRFAFA